MLPAFACAGPLVVRVRACAEIRTYSVFNGCSASMNDSPGPAERSCVGVGLRNTSWVWQSEKRSLRGLRRGMAGSGLGMQDGLGMQESLFSAAVYTMIP